MDKRRLADVLRKLDHNALLQLASSSPEAESARLLVDEFRETGCLLIKYPDERRAAKRDQLIDAAIGILDRIGDAIALRDFERHVEDVKAAEIAFRGILAAVKELPVSQLPLDAQAWGVIRQSEREFAALWDSVMTFPDHARKPNMQPLSPHRPVVLESFGKDPISPDDAHQSILRGLGKTLGMLATIGGWYDLQSHELVMPPAPPDDSVDSVIAQPHFAFSSHWSALERAWDCSRLFRRPIKAIRDKRESHSPDSPATLVVASDPGQIDLLDRISIERLARATYGYAMRATAVENAVHINDATPPRGLPPHEYFCKEEKAVFQALLNGYCVPIDNINLLYAGLPLVAWLRAYTLLHYVAATSRARHQRSGFVRLSVVDIERQLIGVGLTIDQAQRFINLTVFSRESPDLFDSPFLRQSDGSLMFCSMAYAAPNVGVIMLSRLLSLNRLAERTSDDRLRCDFPEKGLQFESNVIQMFRRAGMVAGSLAYTVDGRQYQCDVAAIVDDALVVIECKNRLLPLAHVSSLFYFLREMQQAREQVARIARQLEADPSIVKRQLGLEVRWNRIIPVVLSAMPWSMPPEGGVYFYDYSALAVLLVKGWVEIGVESRNGPRERITRRLRAGPRPSAKELVRELKSPVQLEMAIDDWRPARQSLEVLDGLYLSVCEWVRVDRSFGSVKKRFLRSAPASSFESDSTESSPIDGGSSPAGGTPVRSLKIKRNSECPCGSGKKFKKCCLPNTAPKREA